MTFSLCKICCRTHRIIIQDKKRNTKTIHKKLIVRVNAYGRPDCKISFLFLTTSLWEPTISYQKNIKQKSLPQMGEDLLIDITGLWQFQGFLSLEFLFGSSFLSPWVKNVKIPVRSLVKVTKFKRVYLMYQGVHLCLVFENKYFGSKSAKSIQSQPFWP